MFVTIGAGSLVMAFAASFIFSWIGIVWLIDFLKRGRLLYFAIYCYVVAFLCSGLFRKYHLQYSVYQCHLEIGDCPGKPLKKDL